MVQRKLLTSHPGSIHGGEETPGGRPSLWQGAGKRSSGAPDLGSVAAAEQRRDHDKRVLSPRVSLHGEYIGEGGSQRWTRGPRRPTWRGQGWVRAGWPPGPPL